MKDYYDVVPPEVDVPSKACPQCGGTGLVGDGEYACVQCLGTGLVEMTADDYQAEIDAHVDAEIDEAKFRKEA